MMKLQGLKFIATRVQLSLLIKISVSIVPCQYQTDNQNAFLYKLHIFCAC